MNKIRQLLVNVLAGYDVERMIDGYETELHDYREENEGYAAQLEDAGVYPCCAKCGGPCFRGATEFEPVYLDGKPICRPCAVSLAQRIDKNEIEMWLSAGCV